MERLSVSLQEKTAAERELQSRLEGQSQLGETYDMKKQEIISHLM